MRKPIPTPLFVAAVISLTLVAVTVYIILGVTLFESAKADPALHTVQPPTLPQKCEQYRVTPDPDTWDEVTETYPRNEKWENCMGVGHK